MNTDVWYTTAATAIRLALVSGVRSPARDASIRACLYEFAVARYERELFIAVQLDVTQRPNRSNLVPESSPTWEKAASLQPVEGLALSAPVQLLLSLGITLEHTCIYMQPSRLVAFLRRKGKTGYPAGKRPVMKKKLSLAGFSLNIFFADSKNEALDTTRPLPS